MQSSNHENVDFYFHVADGNVLHYAQFESELIDQLCKTFEPARLFKSDQVVIAGEYSLTGLQVSSIVRIDTNLDGSDSRWLLPHGVTEIQQVTEDEFRRQLDQDQTSTPNQQGKDNFRAFAEITLTNQQHIYLRITTQVADGINQRTTIQQFLAGSYLFCRGIDGGSIMLNTQHVARWSFFPRPDVVPANALELHFRSSIPIEAGRENQPVVANAYKLPGR